MLKIPIKTVVIRDIIQKESFLMPSAMPDFEIMGDTEDARLIARYPPISGITAKFEMKLTPCVADKSSVLMERAVTAPPAEATITAKTGIKAVINTEQPFIALTQAEIIEKTGAEITAAAERAVA